MNSMSKSLTSLSSVCGALLCVAVFGSACEPAASPTKDTTSAAQAAPAPAAPAPTAAAVAPSAPAPAVTVQAVIGQPAPAFSLKDLEGNTVTLQQFKGRRVVLEWFNPNCPFVKAAHTKGSLVTAAAEAQKDGTVWLAINSAAPGKQGYGLETNQAGKTSFHLTHPILLDETGQVGHLYGATNTPHLFVIDESGTLVYAGAVDNSPDGEGASPEGGKLVSYVSQALAELTAKKPITVSSTKAYGCGVKY